MLTTVQKLDILKSLKRWLGLFRISFTGGEPLMKRSEILELTRYCYENEIMSSTNTAAFVLNENYADQLMDCRLTELIVSLDARKPEIHDHIRGRKGAFDKVIKMIEYMNSRRGKMILTVRAVINNWNLDEIVPLVDWTESANLDGIGFHAIESDFRLGNNGKSIHKEWYKQYDMWPKDTAKTLDVIEQLIEMKKAGRSITTNLADLYRMRKYFVDPHFYGEEQDCYVGVKNFAIKSYGDVYICFLMPEIGNIKDMSLSSLWVVEAKKSREIIKDCNKNCSLLGCNRKHSIRSQIGPFLRRIGFMKG